VLHIAYAKQTGMPFGLSKPSSTYAQRNNKENLPVF